jgi:hypothetical protein
MVVLLSPEARESKWVREELNFAQMCNIAVFPVLARGDEQTAIPFGFSLMQRVDIRHEDDFEMQIRQLAHALTAHLLSLGTFAQE